MSELQHASIGSVGGASFTLTLPSSVVAGDVMILATLITSGDVTSITDTAGSSWTQAVSVNGGGGDFLSYWYAEVLASGTAPTLTVNFSGGHYTSILAERDDIATSGQPATSSVLTFGTTGGGPVTLTTSSVTGVGNIGTAFIGNINILATAGVGEVLTDSVAPVAILTVGAQAEYQTATVDNTTYTAEFDFSGFSGYYMLAVVWLAGGAPPPPPPPPVHSGLTGVGVITVTSPVALSVECDDIPPNLGQGVGNPTAYFKLATVSFADANGAVRNYYVEHDLELVIAPFPNATLVYYYFAPGVIGTITELTVP